MAGAAVPGTVWIDAAPAGLVRVVVAGAVDAAVADSFAAACEQAWATRPGRIELDLSGVDSVGAAGVAVIAWCLSLQQRLTGGVGVSVATAAGRRALLAAADRI